MKCFYFVFIVLLPLLSSSQDNDLRQEYFSKLNNELNKFSLKSLKVSQFDKNCIETIYGDFERIDSTLIMIFPKYSSKDSVFVEYGRYKVFATSKLFNSKNHKINKLDSNCILEIDDKFKFGVYLSEPDFELSNFTILYNTDTVQFNRTNWAYFFNPRLECTRLSGNNERICGVRLYYNKKTNKTYVYLEGSDGGDFYSVIFVFYKNFYIGKVINIP